MDTKLFNLLLLTAALIFISCGNRDTTHRTDMRTDTISERTDHMTGDTGTMGGEHMMSEVDLNASMKTMMDHMHKFAMTADADYNFAAMMIHHHDAAIDMANKVKTAGKDEQIKKMADDIITKQQKEKMELQQWLGKRSSKPEEYQAKGNYKDEMDKAMNTMMTRMDHKSTGDADRDFAEMMTAHHQDAVMMADIELDYGQDAEMKSMAKKMKEDQQKEIRAFQDWLQKNKK